MRKALPRLFAAVLNAFHLVNVTGEARAERKPPVLQLRVRSSFEATAKAQNSGNPELFQRKAPSAVKADAWSQTPKGFASA